MLLLGRMIKRIGIIKTNNIVKTNAVTFLELLWGKVKWIVSLLILGFSMKPLTNLIFLCSVEMLAFSCSNNTNNMETSLDNEKPFTTVIVQCSW